MSRSDDEDLLRLVDKARDWLAEGDLERAERMTAKAIRRAPSHPETLCLQGDLALAKDEVDEALRHYERAIDTAPEWPDPTLAAAEVELVDMEDPSACEARLRPFLARELDDDARAQALLLAARALVSLERAQDAAARLAEIEALELDAELRREAWLEAGDLALDAEADALAERFYRGVLAREQANGDALHGIGTVHALRGEREASAAAWLRVRALDAQAPRPAWAPDAAHVMRVVESAMAELPPEVRERLASVPVVVEDQPSESLVREGVDPRLLGLFWGSGAAATNEGSPHAPDVAYVFLANLERASHDREDLDEQIRITVWHETAHYFGLDDDALDAIGLG